MRLKLICTGRSGRGYFSFPAERPVNSFLRERRRSERFKMPSKRFPELALSARRQTSRDKRSIAAFDAPTTLPTERIGGRNRACGFRQPSADSESRSPPSGERRKRRAAVAPLPSGGKRDGYSRRGGRARCIRSSVPFQCGHVASAAAVVRRR